MPKPERGLPKDFDLKVDRNPVQLGDYLDEPPPPPPPRPAPAPAPEPVFQPAIQPPPIPPMGAARPQGIPRKQLNMTPETQQMVDDLLDHIRSNSAERDVRASELFHALVLTVHEVRPFLDLRGVAQRGRWGSATAAQLPVSLKDAFQDAVARARRR